MGPEAEVSSYRALAPVREARGAAGASPAGDRPEMGFLPVDRLVVDERYQRQITAKGRANILRIFATFDWRKFAPIVVTPVGGGRYAIIDGQHRATAALMHPAIDMVPCLIVKATTAEAAHAFAAINGETTRVTTGQVFHARLACGDTKARAVADVCDAAGVVLLRQKAMTSRADWRRGETMAISTIERALDAYGRDTLITALQCVTETGDGNPGALRSAMIWAVCEVLDARRDWRDAGSRLLDAVDSLAFAETYDQAVGAARRERVTVRQALVNRLVRHLATRLTPAATVALPRAAE